METVSITESRSLAYTDRSRSDGGPPMESFVSIHEWMSDRWKWLQSIDPTEQFGNNIRTGASKMYRKIL